MFRVGGPLETSIILLQLFHSSALTAQEFEIRVRKKFVFFLISVRLIFSLSIRDVCLCLDLVNSVGVCTEFSIFTDRNVISLL